MRRKRVYISPYHMGGSARDLARAIGARRIRVEGSRYRPRTTDVVVNWGRSSLPFRGARVLNEPENVAIAINKVQCLTLLSHNHVPTVEWTTDYETAESWWGDGTDEDTTPTVVQRNTITGRGGEGIVLCGRDRDPTHYGRLWTKYFKRKHEYRVHVVGGEAVDFARKKLRTEVRDRIRGYPELGYEIYAVRSHNNGWVFARENVELPELVKVSAIRAVHALGLDFGAVDIGHNVKDDKVAVFEVNTAPGIEGTTLERYADALRRMVV